jgi:hypothetical protein
MQSLLFSYDRLLEACGKRDLASISAGATGDHVSRIQTALFLVIGVSAASDELQNQSYGPSTAGLVLAFQTRRKISNEWSVGRATMEALDREVAAIEGRLSRPTAANHQLTYTPA